MALTRKQPIARKSRLKARGKPRFKKGRDKDYLARVGKLPCVVTGLGQGGFLFWHQVGDVGHFCRVVAAHPRSRGAGAADRGGAVPLLWCLHEEQHAHGLRTFEEKYRAQLGGKSLAAKAVEVQDLLETGGF